MFNLINSVSPFKGIQKRLSTIASNLFSGPSSIKLLKNALEAGDEEKAIEIYMTVPEDAKNGGKPVLALKDEMNPSMPFPSKKSNMKTNYQTPLHLAAKMGMYRIFMMFMENGGNPNFPNGRDETCLHCVCSGSDVPSVRKEIMDIILEWKGMEVNGVSESVSVNHVDIDGNIALHYAAANGLGECVERLVELNSILSLVNKSQMTCSEMADESNHKDMASMLELSILFQPTDGDDYVPVTGQSFTNTNNNRTNRQDTFIVDSLSMNLSDLKKYTTRMIDETYVRLTNMDDLNGRNPIATSSDNDNANRSSNSYLSRERVEAILNAYSWDAEKLISDYSSDPNSVYIQSKLNHSTIAMNVQSNEKEELYCSICSDVMLPILQSNDLKDAYSITDRHSLVCPAGHQYCLECWRSHLQVQIKDNGHYSLSCPGYKCHELVCGGDMWIDVLFPSSDENTQGNSALADRFHEQRARHVVDCCSSTMKWCPMTDCGAVVKVNKAIYASTSAPTATAATASANAKATPNKSNDDTPVVDFSKSTLCHNSHCFCLLCGSDSHAPCSCDDWKKWQSRVQEEMSALNESSVKGSSDDVANALWIAANTKKCPRCTAPIEKDEGCNHMSCRKCRHEFCWICMQDWSTHSNTTGGFFQCNKFVNELMQGSSTDGDSNLVADPSLDDLGNAHSDAARAKERLAKMAKFISLYTRFKAHTDSVNMERKIYPETMTRIIKSLDNTYRSATCTDTTVALSSRDINSKTGLLGSRSRSHSSPIRIANTAPGKWLWMQKSRVMHPYDSIDPANVYISTGHNYPACLKALQDGFQELLKCRYFLIGSVAYAYTLFVVEKDETESLMKALSRGRGGRYQATMRLDDHRLSFERLQGELEMYCEMLSDVVARRRLRAGTEQITGIMQFARATRLELEELIYMYHWTEAYERQESNSKSELRYRGNRSSDSKSNRRNTRDDTTTASPAELLSRFKIGPNGLTYEPDSFGEDADDMDVASLTSLILEMEHYQQLQKTHAANSTNSVNSNNTRDNSRRESLDPNHVVSTPTKVSDMSDMQILQTLQSNTHNLSNPSPNANSNSNAVPSTNMSTSTTTATTPRNNDVLTIDGITFDFRKFSTSPTSNGRVSFNESNNQTAYPDHHALSQNGSSDESLNNSNRDSANFEPPPLPIHLSRRAEEESALNRAILLSLSENRPHATTSNTNTTSVAVDEGNVTILESMGFSRDSARQALVSTNNNIDSALNTLLNIP